MTQCWEPLLDGVERERALELVRAIATAVRGSLRPGWQGLMGTTGISVFLAQAECLGIGDGLGSLDALERALVDLRTDEMKIGLWTGVAGLRWAVSQLAASEDSRMLLRHIDGAVLAQLDYCSPDDWDLYSGLAGILITYADADEKGDIVVSRVLDQLVRIDLSHPRHNELGCAHGIAGVLSALACCHAHGRADDRLQTLMMSLARALENVDVSAQRVGWCRGELGIAIALLGAAQVLRNEDLAARALSVALAPFDRKGGMWPIDAGLCHGAAGVAHLCNRMYQATGDGRLAEHARTWLRKTMAMGDRPDGVAGFSMFRQKPEPVWEADPSFLAGASGVGLALLAGASSVVPSWDRTLGAELWGRRSEAAPDW